MKNKRLKVLYSFYRKPGLRSVTCHMGSQSVTCHPTQVNALALTPAR